MEAVVGHPVVVFGLFLGIGFLSGIAIERCLLVGFIRVLFTGLITSLVSTGTGIITAGLILGWLLLSSLLFVTSVVLDLFGGVSFFVSIASHLISKYWIKFN